MQDDLNAGVSEKKIQCQVCSKKPKGAAMLSITIPVPCEEIPFVGSDTLAVLCPIT
jgi:hypothetical protein